MLFHELEPRKRFNNHFFLGYNYMYKAIARVRIFRSTVFWKIAWLGTLLIFFGGKDNSVSSAWKKAALSAIFSASTTAATAWVTFFSESLRKVSKSKKIGSFDLEFKMIGRNRAQEKFFWAIKKNVTHGVVKKVVWDIPENFGCMIQSKLKALHFPPI